MGSTQVVKILDNGYLRIPEELLPNGKRVNYFSILCEVSGDKYTLTLEPLARANKSGLHRKAVYTNKDAKSPYISLRKLLGVFGNGHHTEATMKRLSNGLIEVKF